MADAIAAAAGALKNEQETMNHWTFTMMIAAADGFSQELIITRLLSQVMLVNAENLLPPRSSSSNNDSNKTLSTMALMTINVSFHRSKWAP